MRSALGRGRIDDVRDPGDLRHREAAQPPVLAAERANWDFFTKLPDPDRTALDLSVVKGTQFAQPLFKFSGACVGCAWVMPCSGVTWFTGPSVRPYPCVNVSRSLTHDRFGMLSVFSSRTDSITCRSLPSITYLSLSTLTKS